MHDAGKRLQSSDEIIKENLPWRTTCVGEVVEAADHLSLDEQQELIAICTPVGSSGTPAVRGEDPRRLAASSPKAVACRPRRRVMREILNRGSLLQSLPRASRAAHGEEKNRMRHGTLPAREESLAEIVPGCPENATS